MSQSKLTFQLTAKNFLRLQRLASQTGSTYRGKPSWRTFIRRLAEGELEIKALASSPEGEPLYTEADVIAALRARSTRKSS
jgi:hypothetical protein